MGSCGSSVADRAIGLDGHDAIKDYSIEKAKQDFIENYIKEIYKNTSQNIKQLKQKKLAEIEEDENDARKIVQSVK
jgi:flagellar motor component MotA